MAHQYRPANALHLQISPHLHLSSVQLASLIHIVAALMAALIALALLRPLPAAASIQPSLFDYPASARDQAFPQTADLALALAPEPLWLAIDDDRSGVTVELPWKWHETAQSPRHEQEVLQSPGWTFSRLYDCTKPACGTTIRAIISGGLLPAGLNISNVDDLHRKMPRGEVARITAMIAGVATINPEQLEGISRGSTYGYRLSVERPQDDGAPGNIAITIDCLYGAGQFIILTAVTEAGVEQQARSALDEIARGISSFAAPTRRDISNN